MYLLRRCTGRGLLAILAVRPLVNNARRTRIQRQTSLLCRDPTSVSLSSGRSARHWRHPGFVVIPAAQRFVGRTTRQIVDCID